MRIGRILAFIILAITLAAVIKYWSIVKDIPAGIEDKPYSGIYASAMYDDDKVQDLKQSGLTTLILFTIHINADGSMNFNDTPIINASGEYIGPENWPATVRAHRQGESSIERIEICVGAWGSPSYDNITKLMAEFGQSAANPLYKGWHTLKELTGADAINHDDEKTFDVDATTEFILMTEKLGYKHTFVPFNHLNDFWKPLFDNVEAARPGLIDRVYVQCYDGGAPNQYLLNRWNVFGNIKVSMGLWAQRPDGSKDTPADFYEKLNENARFIDGGFIWEYNEMLNNPEGYKVKEYADAINKALK